VEFTHWKRRLQDHFERMGFSLLTERLAMQDMVKLEATHGAFLFFPVTIHLYERSGWKMIAFEAETEEDSQLVEQQIASLFQLLMVTFQEEEREFLLGFHANTGRYLTDRNAPVGRLVRLIEECWYDGDVLRVETFDPFPGLFVAPPFAHQSYAFMPEERTWRLSVGRTGRPANDYRFDGTILSPHRLPESELFTVTPRSVLLEDENAIRTLLETERQTIANFHERAMATIRAYDPSFGFAWRGTQTFFHGVPVNPFAQRLWLENGVTRYRILQQGSTRLLASGETCDAVIEMLDDAVSSEEPDGQSVSPIGQLILGIWQQIESDEATYITNVDCRGISRTQADNRIRHALARKETIEWVHRAPNEDDICRFAGLTLTFPHRPPGVVTIERTEAE